jgi:hypothetical protein
VTTPPPPHAPSALKDLADTEGDRPSVTDVHGTIARFEMSYEPPSEHRVKFDPPLRVRLPSAIYLAAAIALAALVIIAFQSSPSSRLFVWFVEGDRNRPLGSPVLTTIIVVSALGTFVRARMRGVVVSPDWLEARYLLPLGIPKARRWGWPQVHRLVIDSRAIKSHARGTQIGIELYDGTFERLPEVAQPGKLADLLMHHAGEHRIEVTELLRD